PLVAWRPDPASSSPPPKGATGDGGFRVMPDMMSILGCSPSDVREVLQKLGFRAERAPQTPIEERPPAEAPAAPEAAAEAPNGEGAAPLPGESGVMPVESAQDSAAQPAREKPASDPRSDEIWRPKRQGRSVARPRRRDPVAEASKEEARP